MKGKVLAFDPGVGTGVINGEDGKRYAYTASDNKSPNATRAGDDVDFVADGANAKDIFVLMAAPAAAAPGIDLSGIAADPTVKNILAKPYVIWAAVVILGSLLGGYLGAIQLIGGGPMGIFGFSGFILALLFLIPVAAAVLIYFELTNHKLTQTMRLVTMGAAIGGPIILPTLAGMMLGVGNGLGAAYGSFGLVGFHLDLGTIVTVGGGVLMLLTHLGIIKKLG